MHTYTFRPENSGTTRLFLHIWYSAVFTQQIHTLVQLTAKTSNTINRILPTMNNVSFEKRNWTESVVYKLVMRWVLSRHFHHFQHNCLIIAMLSVRFQKFLISLREMRVLLLGNIWWSPTIFCPRFLSLKSWMHR